VAAEGVVLTHPDRVLYPEPGITKRGLAEYYAKIAPVMLPHVVGRPVVVVRCPSGQGKPCFYQKHWSAAVPSGLATVPIEEANGTTEPYVVIEDARGLRALVQYGVLEIHLWNARVDRLESPDRIVFDLDPAPDVAWTEVVRTAQELRDRLAAADLRSWVKTTGGKGLHVVLPIERRSTWALVSSFAEAVAERMRREAPDRFVTNPSKQERRGKIYLDWVRNTRGALVVAPWSTRASDSAPVSAPVSWDTLATVRSGDQFTLQSTIATVPRTDPWADLPEVSQRLSRSLVARLAG
jgi:bifunctional non-homologous end joining protein LigD